MTYIMSTVTQGGLGPLSKDHDDVLYVRGDHRTGPYVRYRHAVAYLQDAPAAVRLRVRAAASKLPPR
jgi:hypothetical protein